MRYFEKINTLSKKMATHSDKLKRAKELLSNRSIDLTPARDRIVRDYAQFHQSSYNKASLVLRDLLTHLKNNKQGN